MADLGCRDTDCTYPLPTLFVEIVENVSRMASRLDLHLLSDEQRPMDMNNDCASISYAWMVSLWVSYHESAESDVFRVSV